jgi:hypothetical protein
MFHITEDDYPKNYDWLTKEQQKDIISYLTEMNDDTNSLWKLYNDSRTTEKQRIYRQMWFDTENEKQAVIDFLKEVLHVKVAYNWFGHKGKYFLATYDDACDQIAYLEDLKCGDNLLY